MRPKKNPLHLLYQIVILILKKIKKKIKNFFSAPLINAAVDRYNRIDDRIHHQELISEVANRISMLEREKEYLTRQLNSSLLSRPTLWV